MYQPKFFFRKKYFCILKLNKCKYSFFLSLFINFKYINLKIKLLENLRHPHVITYFNSFKEKGNITTYNTYKKDSIKTWNNETNKSLTNIRAKTEGKNNKMQIQIKNII